MNNNGNPVWRYFSAEEQKRQAQDIYNAWRADLIERGRFAEAAALPDAYTRAPLHPRREQICMELFGYVPDDVSAPAPKRRKTD